MGTFAELKTRVQRELADPDGVTFDSTITGDLINASLAEVGRVAPDRFQEDISTVADTLSYVLRTDVFEGEEIPEIELTRVEVWDNSTTPHRAVWLLQPQSAEPIRYSQAGWVLWNGRLELPNRVVDAIDVTKHYIRVWGYSPYVKLVADEDVVPVGNELYECVVLLARVEAVRKLIGSRVLFKQWQTRSNNTDVTMAQLMNDLSVLSEDWRRKSRAIFVLREAP